MDARLIFLPNAADEPEGLGDAGIESFKDSPYSSLARECGQNSNDAAVHRPVIVSYDVIEVPLAEIPSLEQLRAALKSCLRSAKGARDEKSIDFFDHALAVSAGETIRVMRVSDTNTHGLIGPCSDNTPFHSMLKGAGVSKKDSDTSGGSFGIGKNAAFAVSDLQTVFYSTVYVDQGGRSQFLAQGKSKLASHVDGQEIPRRATGYWGDVDGFMPVNKVELVPKWLRRTEVGTSVFALGFREVANWEYRMTYSLLTNFFVAIYRGSMVFNVGSTVIVSSATLDQLFQDPRIEQAAKDDGHRDAFQFSRDLYRCLIAPEAADRRVNIEGLGEVTIRVSVSEGLPKRVAIVRNGMLITDSLENFGDKFSRFPLYRDFVAIVEPLEIPGNALLKKLENIKHDALSAERLPDPKKRDAARKVMVQLAKAIRDTIKNETSVSHEAEVPLDEMSEFFSEGNADDRPPDPDAERDLRTMVYQPAVRTRQSSKSATAGHGSKGGAGGKRKNKKGRNGGRGSGTGQGDGGKGDRGEVRPMELQDVRHTPSTDRLPNKRTIYFTPDASGIANITFEATGLNSSERLDVVEADKGKPVLGSLWVPVEQGKRNVLNIAFSVDYDGPVEMTALRVADLPGGK